MKWPQQIQGLVLGSLATGIFKIHLKEFRFLMKAGLRLFQALRYFPKPCTRHAEVKTIDLRGGIQTDHRPITSGTGASKQNSV